MTGTAHPAVVLRGRPLPADRAAVMAIVNRTPDSFFDAGATFGETAAMEAVRRAVDEGADLVDIGGVKAGVGPEVTESDEIDRVVPFVARVRERFPELPISVDTWRAGVAVAACEAGADLINDTWAGADPDLAHVAARFGAGIVCSHTGGAAPRTNPYRVSYPDVVAAVIEQTTTAARRMVELGVPRAGVLIDPTHDFGKNTWHSLELVHRTGELVATGWPVLMALSNKDFVGETLDLPVDQRLEGTLAATAIAVWQGAAVVRAHQVRATRRVVEMAAAVAGTRAPLAPRRGLV
ncbi:dihydropteroate synthase [Nakamurella multipartita]|jgi:dihydropteroate synthase|uniref:Dihydropteroate synthase n=1 Tax=Nakamurella multipartita (strain ATCC 700099 / DSM 44233 / CIP 104796 / JCM 9543 / NBRC 105858 / Y-104) TaxID=479431 RepID=C8XJ58_NAKMY|nr:dihydropteroate synthase [Nakamurella multipartita]ACV78523.1 dihydropteroate synthase [Nakamurella multipartita DSM 44233]HOZ57232.1 dihydropteroate synthase [Nakamurella multipartita]